MFQFARVPFWEPIFDPQPCDCPSTVRARVELRSLSSAQSRLLSGRVSPRELGPDWARATLKPSHKKHVRALFIYFFACITATQSALGTRTMWRAP